MDKKFDGKVIFWTAILLMVPAWLWQGWLGSYVWRWFAVEIFGARPLSVGECIGTIMLLFYFLPTQVSPKPASTGEAIGRAISYSFLLPLWMFTASAIVHAFIR